MQKSYDEIVDALRNDQFYHWMVPGVRNHRLQQSKSFFLGDRKTLLKKQTTYQEYKHVLCLVKDLEVQPIKEWLSQQLKVLTQQLDTNTFYPLPNEEYSSVLKEKVLGLLFNEVNFTWEQAKVLRVLLHAVFLDDLRTGYESWRQLPLVDPPSWKELELEWIAPGRNELSKLDTQASVIAKLEKIVQEAEQAQEERLSIEMKQCHSCLTPDYIQKELQSLIPTSWKEGVLVLTYDSFTQIGSSTPYMVSTMSRKEYDQYSSIPLFPEGDGKWIVVEELPFVVLPSTLQAKNFPFHHVCFLGEEESLDSSDPVDSLESFLFLERKGREREREREKMLCLDFPFYTKTCLIGFSALHLLLCIVLGHKFSRSLKWVLLCFATLQSIGLLAHIVAATISMVSMVTVRFLIWFLILFYRIGWWIFLSMMIWKWQVRYTLLRLEWLFLWTLTMFILECIWHLVYVVRTTFHLSEIQAESFMVWYDLLTAFGLITNSIYVWYLTQVPRFRLWVSTLGSLVGINVFFLLIP